MTPERLRQLAEQCRELSTKAKVPEVRAQLALWAVEFEAAAPKEETEAPVIAKPTKAQ